MKKISFVLVLLLSVSAFAGSGKDVGNGGDMCEDRIKIIRDDIASWLKSGGSLGLKLPGNLSKESFDQGMLGQIKRAKIICTDAKLHVGGAEKTCVNLRSNTSRVTCNRLRFTQTDDSDQYVLIHHEYAGLSGFELNKGAESDYQISDQISEYLEDQVIKKLSIKKKNDLPSNDLAVAVSPANGYIVSGNGSSCEDILTATSRPSDGVVASVEGPRIFFPEFLIQSGSANPITIGLIRVTVNGGPIHNYRFDMNSNEISALIGRNGGIIDSRVIINSNHVQNKGGYPACGFTVGNLPIPRNSQAFSAKIRIEVFGVKASGPSAVGTPVYQWFDATASYFP